MYRLAMKFSIGVLVMFSHLMHSKQITPAKSTQSNTIYDNITQSLMNFDLNNMRLTILAQGAANQAYTAASSQEAAANQATQLAKVNIAEWAERAAIAAQVAYLAKYALIDFLEEQRKEALMNLDSELNQYQLVKEASDAAAHKAQLALHYAIHLADVLRMAEDLAEHAVKEAQSAQEILSNQRQMIDDARTRVDVSDKQVATSQKEYDDISHATSIALKAARIAHTNARKARTFLKKEEENQNHKATTRDVNEKRKDESESVS